MVAPILDPFGSFWTPPVAKFDENFRFFVVANPWIGLFPTFNAWQHDYFHYIWSYINAKSYVTCNTWYPEWRNISKRRPFLTPPGKILFLDQIKKQWLIIHQEGLGQLFIRVLGRSELVTFFIMGHCPPYPNGNFRTPDFWSFFESLTSLITNNPINRGFHW